MASHVHRRLRSTVSSTGTVSSSPVPEGRRLGDRQAARAVVTSPGTGAAASSVRSAVTGAPDSSRYSSRSRRGVREGGMIPLLPCGDGAAVRRRHIQEGAALQLLMYLRLYRLRGARSPSGVRLWRWRAVSQRVLYRSVTGATVTVS